MEPGKFLQGLRSVGSPLGVVVVTTLGAVSVSVFCLSSGHFIIFQNLFYIPIVVACICYTMRGFVFSVVLAGIYFCLIMGFTQESIILLEAFVRSLIFVLIAGIITYLSSVRVRAESILREQHGDLENLVRERTKQFEEGVLMRERLEKELAQAKETQFRTLMELLPAKVFLKDRSSVYLSCNESFAKDLKIKPEEVAGKTDYDFFPTPLAEKKRAEDRRVMTSGETESREEAYHMITDYLAGSKTSYINIVKAPIRDREGSVTGLLGIFWDITERKEIEDALRKNKELLFEMTEQVPGVVYQFYARSNGEKGFYYVSGNSDRIFGLKQDPGTFFEGFVAQMVPEYREGLLSSIEKAVRSRSEWKYEGIFQKPSGEKIWFSGNSIPLIRGDEVVFNGILTDITERKTLEAEMRKVLGLKTATEIKNKFTTMVSHELRTPLSVIKEALNIVLDGVVGSVDLEQKKILEMAKTNTDRLGRLINNVLDFQKIEAGKMQFDVRENDLAETLTEVLGSMNVLSKRKGLDLRSEIEGDLPHVDFDQDKIIQVLTNLVSNAISNTESGSVNLMARREKDVVHLSVQDTGCGVPAAEIPRLFEPFEQVDGSAKKKGGTGLGLAISKEIILAHRGKIWVESELGKGTTFHFTLPVCECRGPA